MSPVPESLVQRLAKTKAALEMLEEEILGCDNPPRDVLQDFRAGIDDIRISLWAVLTSQQHSGYESVVAQFRLRRAVELWHQVLVDLDIGRLSTNDDEVHRLNASVATVYEELGQRVTMGG
jgi:hypothetical protein